MYSITAQWHGQRGYRGNDFAMKFLEVLIYAFEVCTAYTKYPVVPK